MKVTTMFLISFVALSAAQLNLVDFNPEQLAVFDQLFHGEKISLKLRNQPASDLTVHVRTENRFRISGPCSLKFTPQNFDKAQEIILSANAPIPATGRTNITIVFESCDQSINGRTQVYQIVHRAQETRKCSVTGDPHYRTWDGRAFSTQDSGLFSVIQSDRITVQAEFYKCHTKAHVTCTSAVSFRYMDTFVYWSINTAETATAVNAGVKHELVGPNQERIAVQKKSDSEVHFVLSDGTRVELHAIHFAGGKHWYTNINVYAYASYAHKVDGICGNFNFKKEDDCGDSTCVAKYRIPDNQDYRKCRGQCPVTPWDNSKYGQTCPNPNPQPTYCPRSSSITPPKSSTDVPPKTTSINPKSSSDVPYPPKSTSNVPPKTTSIKPKSSSDVPYPPKSSSSNVPPKTSSESPKSSSDVPYPPKSSSAAQPKTTSGTPPKSSSSASHPKSSSDSRYSSFSSGNPKSTPVSRSSSVSTPATSSRINPGSSEAVYPTSRSVHSSETAKPTSRSPSSSGVPVSSCSSDIPYPVSSNSVSTDGGYPTSANPEPHTTTPFRTGTETLNPTSEPVATTTDGGYLTVSSIVPGTSTRTDLPQPTCESLPLPDLPKSPDTAYGQAIKACGEIIGRIQCGNVCIDFHLSGCILDGTAVGDVQSVAQGYLKTVLALCRNECHSMRSSGDPEKVKQAQKIESKYGLQYNAEDYIAPGTTIDDYRSPEEAGYAKDDAPAEALDEVQGSGGAAKSEVKGTETDEDYEQLVCKNGGTPSDQGCKCTEGYGGYDCSTSLNEYKAIAPTKDELQAITGFNGEDSSNNAASFSVSAATVLVAVFLLFQ